MAGGSPQIRIVAMGHVDHGKSTLIGRLLHDTGNLPDGKVEEIAASCERRHANFEWSFVLDALQSERDQAVTIDKAQTWLRHPERDIVFIDAPGHVEFLSNLVAGVSDADAALFVVDAAAPIDEQTHRQMLLLGICGIRDVVVVVNKMDTVDYDAARFSAVSEAVATSLGRAGEFLTTFVPACARDGENVAARSTAMAWYGGPTVLEALLALESRRQPADQPLRIAVQGVLRSDLKRVIVGRILSGRVRAGDEVVVLPVGRTTRVRSLEFWPPNDRSEAAAGESVGLTLDGSAFVERGDVIADSARPARPATSFRARVLWFGPRPLHAGDAVALGAGTRRAPVEVDIIEGVVNVETLALESARSVGPNQVAELTLRSPEILSVEAVSLGSGLGRFILMDGTDVAGCGTILATFELSAGASNLVPVDHLISRESRTWRNRHGGAVIWLTGLPASGKSTIAMHVERRLFAKGYQVYVLDGDNVRGGLCSDLGFSVSDRNENVRRVGELAALFADAGMIVMAAFISPYREGRDAARRAAGDAFHEVYVKADIATCEGRDPKGHYRKARAGNLPDFTGIAGPYEAPIGPELIVETDTQPIAESVAEVVEYIERHVAIVSSVARGS
jgi:bifunctional enzyme CysN/CysC